MEGVLLTSRARASEKGYDLYIMCSELDDCTKFDWLGEGAGAIKQNLREKFLVTTENKIAHG